MLSIKKAALFVLCGAVMSLGISCLPNIGNLFTGLRTTLGL